MLKPLLFAAALAMMLPTTVFGQLLQEEEMGSVSEPQPCDSQKESTLVTDLGVTIRNRVIVECATH
jgi:hypothetical protein